MINFTKSEAQEMCKAMRTWSLEGIKLRHTKYMAACGGDQIKAMDQGTHPIIAFAANMIYYCTGEVLPNFNRVKERLDARALCGDGEE